AYPGPAAVGAGFASETGAEFSRDYSFPPILFAVPATSGAAFLFLPGRRKKHRLDRVWVAA
ncbi:MAG TPA: hypothetical protein VGA60_13300, partial [Kiloniellales bacterium]